MELDVPQIITIIGCTLFYMYMCFLNWACFVQTNSIFAKAQKFRWVIVLSGPLILIPMLVLIVIGVPLTLRRLCKYHSELLDSL